MTSGSSRVYTEETEERERERERERECVREIGWIADVDTPLSSRMYFLFLKVTHRT